MDTPLDVVDFNCTNSFLCCWGSTSGSTRPSGIGAIDHPFPLNALPTVKGSGWNTNFSSMQGSNWREGWGGLTPQFPCLFHCDPPIPNPLVPAVLLTPQFIFHNSNPGSMIIWTIDVKRHNVADFNCSERSLNFYLKYTKIVGYWGG